MAASNAASNSSSAGISVSGTYRPPNAPKRCTVSVATLVGTKPGCCCKELPHEPRIFNARRALDAGRHVDHVRTQCPDRAANIVRLKTSGQNDGGATPVASQVDGDLAPRKRFAHAAEPLLASRIKNDGVGSIEQHLGVRRNVRASDADCCPNFAGEC